MPGKRRRGLFGAAPNYDTPLQPQQETAFQQWATSQGRTGDLQDYDLRGAWLNNAQQASNGHLPDTYKKPNHPTFSSESQYSTPENPGGRWVDAGNGKWMFWASPANLQYQNAQALVEYFRKREPDSNLFLPFNYRLPSGR